MRMDFVRHEKAPAWAGVTVCNGAAGLCRILLCALSSPLKGKEWEGFDPFKSQHTVVRGWNFENQEPVLFLFLSDKIHSMGRRVEESLAAIQLPIQGGSRVRWDTECVAPSLWESPGLCRAFRNDLSRRQSSATRISEGTPKKICLPGPCISLLTALCSL